MKSIDVDCRKEDAVIDNFLNIFFRANTGVLARKLPDFDQRDLKALIRGFREVIKKVTDFCRSRGREPIFIRIEILDERNLDFNLTPLDEEKNPIFDDDYKSARLHLELRKTDSNGPNRSQWN